MSVFLSPVGGAGVQFFDNNGNPLTGGKLYTYSAGTTTPQATYTSASGTTFHTNPIILDAAGRISGGGEIWLVNDQSYKFVLKDSNDVLIATYDDIFGNGDPAYSYYTPSSSSLLAPGSLTVKSALDQITNENNGALKIGYLAPLANSVACTVGGKLAQTVSVKDFGAVGDGVTDDTAAIQAAINAGAEWVPGTYKITATLTHSGENLVMKGGDASNTIINYTGAGKLLSLTGTKERFEIDGLTFKGGTHGIYYTSGNNFDKIAAITNCKFQSQSVGSIYFDGSGFINGKIENCEISSGAKYGIYFQGDRTMNAVIIRACRISGSTGNGSAGIWINNTVAPGSSSTAKYVRLDCVTFENNQGRALYIRCADVSAESLYFENNGTVYDVPEVGLDSDYNVSYLAYASLHVNNMVFAERGAARTTNTRVEFLNHGVRFLAYASTAPAGGATVDVKNFAILCQLLLNMTDFSVINATNLGNNFRAGASIKTGPIEASGNITTSENLTVSKAIAATGNGFKARFAESAIKTFTLGTTTDIGVNSGTGGQTLLAIASRNTGSGDNTQAAVYLLRTGYDGDRLTQYYLGGNLDFVTFTVASSKIAISGTAGTGLVMFLTTRQDMVGI